ADSLRRLRRQDHLALRAGDDRERDPGCPFGRMASAQFFHGRRYSAERTRLSAKRKQSTALPCSAAAFIFAAAGRQQFPVIESSVSLRRRGGAFDFLPMQRRRKDTSHHVRGGSTYVLFANRKPC